MAQKRPHQRHLETACHNGQNQNIDIGLAEFPVGSVKRKKLCPPEIKQAEDQLCNHIPIQSNVLKKPLQAAIAGSMKRHAGKLARQMAEVNGSAICETGQHNCQGLQSCLAQIEMWA